MLSSEKFANAIFRRPICSDLLKARALGGAATPVSNNSMSFQKTSSTGAPCLERLVEQYPWSGNAEFLYAVRDQEPVREATSASSLPQVSLSQCIACADVIVDSLQQ